MKNLVIILSLLLPMVVMAQKKDKVLNGAGYVRDGVAYDMKGNVDSAYAFKPERSFSTSGFTGLPDSLLKPFSTGHGSLFYPNEHYLQVQTEAKTVMNISSKDKDGNIKVWIDRNRIVWTSDSTFTLRTQD
jgi:hypothetical protein